MSKTYEQLEPVISALNGRLQRQQGIIAETFSAQSTYNVGDSVIYEAGLYTFRANKVAGAWDATKVDGPFKVTDQISSIKEDLSDVKSALNGIGHIAEFTENYVATPFYVEANREVIVKTKNGQNFTGGQLTFVGAENSAINAWSLNSSVKQRTIYPESDAFFVRVAGETDPTNIIVEYADDYPLYTPFYAYLTGGVIPNYDYNTSKLNLKTTNLVIRYKFGYKLITHADMLTQLGSIASEDSSGNLLVDMNGSYTLVYDIALEKLARIGNNKFYPNRYVAVFTSDYQAGVGGLLSLSMSNKKVYELEQEIVLLDRYHKSNIYAFLTGGGSISNYNASTGSFSIGSSNIVVVINGVTTVYTHSDIITHLGSTRAVEDGSGRLTITTDPGYALVVDMNDSNKLKRLTYASVDTKRYILLYLPYYSSGAVGLLAESDNNLQIRNREQFTYKNVINSAPDYVKTDFHSNLAKYATLVADASTTSEKFLFFTDPHCFSNSDFEDWMSGMMATLEKYYNCTPTDYVICGGDWYGNSDSYASACEKMGYIKGLGKSILGGDKFYNLVGNHDTNYQGAQTFTEDEISNLWYSGQPCYYKVKERNCTYFMLDTGVDNDDTLTAYRYEQLKWLCSELSNGTDARYAIIMHIVRNGTSPQYTIPMAEKVGDIISAYNARSTITIDGTSYNFSGKTGKIYFVLGGHIHADYDMTLGGVPCVLTINTGTGGEGTASFDLCVADFENGKLKMTRVGVGSDRTFDI